MTSHRVLTCTAAGFAVLALSVLAAFAASKQSQPPAPKPGPEHEQLKYFIGKWTTDGEMKPSPFMAAGKFSSTRSCELFNGGFYVICHTEGKNPFGPTHDMGIYGYDAIRKVYTYYGISNQMGIADASEGKREGDSWVFSATMDDGSGKKIQGRYTLSDLTPNAYTSKYEMARSGSKDWTLITEAKNTRVSVTAAPSITPGLPGPKKS